MKRFLLVLLCLALVGCATLSQATSRNRVNLIKLSLGMTKQQVLDIMGTKSFTAYYKKQYSSRRAITVTNPYQSEILKGKEYKIVEVIYYLTDDKDNNGLIDKGDLTPFIFEDGRLIGWGGSFLDYIVEKYEIMFDRETG